ncbi:hypothetical protein C2R22_21315 (plasmid) [Salinigranum rubrum]|uniref:Uncharacterized protein n=1 Tax=Salinigranum rubrum TaxID=755307 RepID=A0A2I8VQG8_9EURY|nr:hypothetical protein [Salinigranum rubrum]AUV84124.1 hypothetical protein C2R22_21315 [Salinigranum rubrum]
MGALLVAVATAGCSSDSGGENCRNERVRRGSIPIFRGEGLTSFYEKEWYIEVDAGDVLEVSVVSATETNDEAEVRLHIKPADSDIEGEYQSGFRDRIEEEYRFPNTGRYHVHLREQAPVLVVGNPDYEQASWTIDVTVHNYDTERVCQ